jgi:hypothetical protein
VMANRVKLHPALVAIGVVVIGQLFGFVGLFVAVPILSLIVILVEEGWVKPMEAERGLRPAQPGEVAGAAEPEPAPAEGTVILTGPARPGEASEESPGPRAS